MVKEWDYNCAYENSSKIEYHCRMNPNELHMALGNEG
jgi:hypothetical protein